MSRKVTVRFLDDEADQIRLAAHLSLVTVRDFIAVCINARLVAMGVDATLLKVKELRP